MSAPSMNPTTTASQWMFDLLPLPGGDLTVPDPVAQPAQCATYLTGVRSVVEQNNSVRPLIRIWDSDLNDNAQVTGELNCSAEELAEDTGSCEIEILFDNWLMDWITNQTMLVADLHITIDWRPTNPSYLTRWGGKIIEIHVGKNREGVASIKLKALSNREHAKRLLVAANPILPPETQLPRIWVMPGPCNTVCATTALINLARIFEVGWSQIDNALNPFAWVQGTNILPTQYPIQIAYLNPITDQSRWAVLGANWTSTWHDAFKDLLAGSGCFMKVYTYLTTDLDNPNNQLQEALQQQGGGDILGNPQRNCVIFSFENKSGATGPTGTLFDGLLSLVAVTLDDLITPIMINPTTGDTFDAGQILNGESVEDATGLGQTYLLEQLLGVAPVPPNVVWWDGRFNGTMNSDCFLHKGTVKNIMVGGHSPVLVNQAQTFAIKYALAELSYLIYVGNPNGAASAQWGGMMTPGTPGLDALYQGQLNDVLFAWERFTDPIRAFYAGDLSYQEHFQKGTSGTAYTLAGILDLRMGDWNTRAYGTFKAQTYDGHPWVADYDYFLGDRVGFEQNGVIWVDNVYKIKREWDWEKPLLVEVTVGEDKQKGDPFMAAFKTLAMIYSFISNLAGEGTIFDGGS